MIITAQTTLLDFACWYATDLEEFSAQTKIDGAASRRLMDQMEAREDGPHHDRAMRTAARAAQEEFRINGAALTRRRMFMEHLQTYIEPLLQGEK